VAEGLPKLAAQFPLFIVSNCQTDYLETFFAWTGYRRLFRDSECHGNTGKSKGENIRLIAERNKLHAPAYIGDTAGDHEAAMRAGADYYHVAYGFGDPARECLVFAKFEEVVNFFLQP
jgi:phosphoglycolate phosphatase